MNGSWLTLDLVDFGPELFGNFLVCSQRCHDSVRRVHFSPRCELYIPRPCLVKLYVEVSGNGCQLTLDITGVTEIDHGYDREWHPSPFIVGSSIQERQVACELTGAPCMRYTGVHFHAVAAFFQLDPTGNFGNGTSDNRFSYSDMSGNTYTREVGSVNSTITYSKEGGSLVSPHTPHIVQADPSQLTFLTPRLPGRVDVGRPI